MATANLLTKMICLLISPLAEDRLLVEEALGRAFADFLVLRVADAAGWQEALATGDFCLGIIADTLPWAETATVVRGLKTLRPECPLIMLAAPEREEAALEALLSGIDDYVLKSPEEMRRLPRVILAARYRARRLAGEPFLTEAKDIIARKEAEEKLRQSELHYRSIFETTGTATCIDDENTVLCLVNEEFAKLSGYSREDLEGKKSWAEFIVPEDLERLQKYHRLRQTDPGAAPKTCYFLWRDRHGRVKDILATITLIPSTKKSVASLLDVSAQQKAEKALRESEVRYRLLVETMNDGVGMQDGNGRITFVNRRLCEMLGYSKEELLGRHADDFLDAANREILKEQRERRMNGERQAYKITWTRKDGTPITTCISPVPMFDARDKFQGSFAVVTDLTARLQGEKALRKSEETYRTIFENTGTATVIAEEDTTISLANAEYLNLSGYSREELEGKKSWTEFFRGDDLKKMLEYHRLRRLDPPQAPRNYEAQFINRQGEVKDILMTVGMIPGTKKSVASLLDITARKKAERELDLERKKFQILTENSHFALAMIEQDGTFKYANPRFSELFGYDLADVPDGRTWFRKAYPEPAYRHEVIAAWKEDLRSAGPGKKRPRMYTVTCKDGSQKIVNFIPVHLHNGDHLMTFEDITERHLAEEALRESEELHSRILDTVPDLVYELSLDGKIVYANSAASEILGYSPAALRQMNLSDLLDEEGLAHALGVIREMVDSREPSRTEYYRLRSAGGDFVHIETHAILMERSNQPPTIIGTARDITERQRAEEALRQAEAEKSLILETMSEMVAYRDLDNRILWANRAAADFIGMSPEQMVGRVCYEVLHQRQTPCPDCRIFEAVATGRPMQTEMIKSDGKIISVRSSPARNETAQVQGSVVVACDITARKRAEKAIKDSEEKMRLVIESAPVGIRIIQHGRHIYVNPALVQMFGYKDDGEIIGWPVALGPLFAPDASVISPEKMAALPQGKEAPSSYEALGLKEGGAWMEVQVWQTEIEYQGAPATLDFILDISEAKALRSQLLHAQKMEAIGTLAGGIAHDFNNILLPILINAEMVQEDLPLDSPLRQKMARVIKACRRAIDLVKQILAFSRHEERGLSPISLAATIEDSLRLLRSTLPATIEIRQHLESDGDTVLADPTQIQQVLINLCTNAAHAIGDRGGVIDIRLKGVDAETARSTMPQNLEPGRWLHLMVKDNGPGMDPAIRERIFDPYFTTKKPEEGTGLGLAVVHGIVKKHGGAIHVESEPGKGSVFHIFLPRAEAEAIPEDRGLTPLPKGRERILLVDNDPEIVATLQQLMEQLGYQVTAQTDSMEALRSFRTRPEDFDLVITDQTMPKLTGEDLVREILDLRPEIPVILCTGFSEAVSREKAGAVGIREFLIKPIATRVMAETIRRALKPKQDLS